MKVLKREFVRDGRAPIPRNPYTSKVMSANKAKNTKPELILRKKLWAENLKGFRVHYKKLEGKPDIAYPKRKLAIFVHGCFWHRCPYCKLSLPKSNIEFWNKKFEANKKRDKIKIRQIEKSHWKSILIWECQIKDISKLNLKIVEIKKIIK